MTKSTFQISIHFFFILKFSSVLRFWAPHCAVDSSTHSFCEGLSCVSNVTLVPLQGLLQDLETGDDVWVERDSACNSPTEAQVGSCFWIFCFFKATQKTT